MIKIPFRLSIPQYIRPIANMSIEVSPSFVMYSKKLLMVKLSKGFGIKEGESFMITVLCYGDSNTYGYNPANGMRYPEDIRWTGRLRNMLGKDYSVIEEGCNGRTTIFDDPVEGWKNGLGYLRPCLNTHKPIDFVIMMLGSNDLKEVFHATPKEIAEGAAALVQVIQEFTEEKQGFVPKIILVSPPHIGEGIRNSVFYESFRENAICRSKELSGYYRKVAEKYNCIFFDSARYVEASKEDSLHLTPEAHKKLAEELYNVVMEN